jgi:hypothetical protein
MFLRYSNIMGHSLIFSYIGVTSKSSTAAINRNYTCKVLNLSWDIRKQRDSNDYTALSGSSITMILVWILSDIGVTAKSNMAAINRKYIGLCKVLYLSLFSLSLRYISVEIPTATPTF